MADSAPAPSGDILAPRMLALQVLDYILTRRQSFDIAWDINLAAFAALDVRDRSFARMLVTTALRRLGQIDDVLAKASAREDAPAPPLLHTLLRIGITQILFMDVPDYAAVDTSVRLGESISLSRQCGFINAVLRQTTREGRKWAALQDASSLNMPFWLRAEWAKDYGIEVSEDISSASLAEAPLDISIRNDSDRSYWAEMLQAVILPTGSLRRQAGGLVNSLPGFADGLWWVQDAAAALPVSFLGDVREQPVIDLCAAPGGKTAQLAAMEAKVTALDRSGKRLRRLEANLARLSLSQNVIIEAADAAIWMPKEPAPFVLLDAPCTATGTIRRNPDVMRLKTPQDMEALKQTQARLLVQAVRMLAPGGRLVYCTCSLQKEEGEYQIDRLLRSGAPVSRLPIRAEEVGGLDSLLTAEGDLRVFPYHLAALGGMDGFYAARLVKNT